MAISLGLPIRFIGIAAATCWKTPDRVFESKLFVNNVASIGPWTLVPASTAVETEAGRELLANVASYAPDAVNKVYAELKRQPATLLKPEMKRGKDLTAKDLAHILALAARCLDDRELYNESIRSIESSLA